LNKLGLKLVGEWSTPLTLAYIIKSNTVMRKSHLLFCASVLLAVSCNNGSETKEEAPKADTSTATHDTSHHAPATAEIAPVPDIPAGAKVHFKNLKDGQTVKSPFKVEMVAEGMHVDTANGIIKAASGHHHILVDAAGPMASGTVIPKDSVHLHFGNAQTSAEIKLPAGKHTLTLQFADGLHRSYGDKLSSTVTVNVKN